MEEREISVKPRDLLREMFIGTGSVRRWVIRNLRILQARAGLEKTRVGNLDFDVSYPWTPEGFELILGHRQQEGYEMAFSVGLQEGKVKMICAHILTDKGLFWTRKERHLKEKVMERIFYREVQHV